MARINSIYRIEFNLERNSSLNIEDITQQRIYGIEYLSKKIEPNNIIIVNGKIAMMNGKNLSKKTLKACQRYMELILRTDIIADANELAKLEQIIRDALSDNYVELYDY